MSQLSDKRVQIKKDSDDKAALQVRYFRDVLLGLNRSEGLTSSAVNARAKPEPENKETRRGTTAATAES